MQTIRYTSPWLMLAMIMFASLLSVVDRQLLSVLVEPIRKDLSITDFQIGLLSGPLFVGFAIFGNLSAGWLVDRFDRAKLIAGSITCWSLATGACGLVAGFWGFLSARAVVGYFEGAAPPGFHSLMADRFERARLPLALSLYTVSGSVGPGLVIILSGFVLDHAFVIQRLWEPLSELQPWRITFMVVGPPGVLLALLFLTLRIPPRPSKHPTDQASHESLVAFWRPQRRLILLYLGGIGLLFASEIALLTWLPTLLIRKFALSASEVGESLGIMLIVLGILGTMTWGFVATTLYRRGIAHAALLTMVGAMGTIVPFTITAPFMPNLVLTLVLFGPVLFCKSAYAGLSHAVVQTITPSAIRGRVAGAYLACAAGIGAFIGPPAIGFLSTYVFQRDDSIGLAIAIVTGVTEILGVTALALCVGPYREALAAQLRSASDHR